MGWHMCKNMIHADAILQALPPFSASPFFTATTVKRIPGQKSGVGEALFS